MKCLCLQMDRPSRLSITESWILTDSQWTAQVGQKMNLLNSKHFKHLRGSEVRVDTDPDGARLDHAINYWFGTQRSDWISVSFFRGLTGSVHEIGLFPGGHLSLVSLAPIYQNGKPEMHEWIFHKVRI